MKTEIEIQIAKECEKFEITKYKINNNGSIDVDGNVLILDTELTSLPLKFNIVWGDFFCSSNKLTTLKGCPTDVFGSFCCSDNSLTSLKYCPAYVSDDFKCILNNLTSLQYCPNDVGGNFLCDYNPINTLQFLPDEIGGDFTCHDNMILLEDIIFSECIKNFDLTKSFGFNKDEIRIAKIKAIIS